MGAGLLHSAAPDWDAWFIVELVRSVHHHEAYATNRTPEMKERLWRFCLSELGRTERQQ